MNTPQTRVTLRDVARAAGVSINAVSLALNNRPGVSAATQERIRTIAARLGYRPDPVLAALVRYRQHRTRRDRGEILALLHAYPAGDMDRYPMLGALRDNARRGAARFGYRLDSFCFQPPLRLDPVLAVLRARGMRGILLAPLPYGQAPPVNPWSGFSVVGLGWSWADTRVPWVGVEHFGDLILAIETIRKAGYRRIGFALSPSQDRRDHHHYAGAFAATRLQAPAESEAIYGLHSWSADGYRQWITRFRPDAVLGTGPDVYHWHATLPRKLSAIGYADMDTTPLPPGVAGIAQRHGAVAEQAVELLHGRMLAGLEGEIDPPFLSLIRGGWADGPTLPRPGPACRKSRSRKSHPSGSNHPAAD